MFIADIVNNKQSLSASFVDKLQCSLIYTVTLWLRVLLEQTTQLGVNNIVFPSRVTLSTVSHGFAMSLTGLWEGESRGLPVDND